LLETDEVRLVAHDESALVRLTIVDPRPPHLRFMKTEGDRCIALDESIAGAHACRVYFDRPDGCRALEAGSPACLEARGKGRLGPSVRYRVENGGAR
jgi:hypothetical protein